MKTTKFSASITAALIFVISLTVLTSFKNTPPIMEKKAACVVHCNFNAVNGNISLGSISNVYGTDTKTGITMGTSQPTSLLGGVSSVSITVGLPLSHPAGTIYVYKNGTLIQSYSIPANRTIGIDDSFPTDCTDQFDVIW